MSTKMALVVRTDLAMGKGKIAAQAAHAAVAAVLASLGTKGTAAWLKDGQPKVVLRVPDANALLAVCADAEASGLPTHRVEDAGRTQVSADTVTCCAIGPALATEIDDVTGRLPLL
jgi:PTH2 family peptidyl-tRNA hydrolase